MGCEGYVRLKRMKLQIGLLLFLFTLLSCGSGGSTGSGGIGNVGCEGASELKVLFIGNSYTYANDLPKVFSSVSCSGGYKVTAESVAVGGYAFSNHVYSAQTTAKINSKKWDYVILQDQSQIPSSRPADVTTYYLPHAVTLANRVLSNHSSSELIYFVTWGRESGDGANCGSYAKVCTFSGHTEALLEGYTQYKNSTGGVLAQVGSAWEAVVDDSSSPFLSGDLWTGDGSHPELLGTYLSALVLYKSIFQKSTLDLYVPSGISSSHGVYLQGVVDAQ